jgi:hypothetical protein
MSDTSVVRVLRRVGWREHRPTVLWLVRERTIVERVGSRRRPAGGDTPNSEGTSLHQDRGFYEIVST